MALGWIDGAIEYLEGADVTGNIVPSMVSAFVGYYGDPGISPTLGEVYDAHIVVSVGNPPRGGVEVQLGTFLPPFTSFNSTGASPRPRCFFKPPDPPPPLKPSQWSEVTNDPLTTCPAQLPTTRWANVTWNLNQHDVPRNSFFEVRFPVSSSWPLPGNNLVGWVGSQYGDIYATVPVRVTGAMPPPPSRGKLAFVQNPPFASIYTMNYDGSDRTLIAEEAYAGQPAWSPDGARIAFVSYRDGLAQIYVMNANGTGQRRITTNPPLRGMTCGSPKWSPEGDRILCSAATQGGNWQIYTVDLNGNHRQLTTGPVNKISPVWMPRTREIAFIGDGDIYLMDYGGQNVLRSTSDGSSQRRYELASHPAHDLLAYTVLGDPRRIRIWNASETYPLTDGEGITFSPDGNWLAYTKREQLAGGATYSLFRIDLGASRDTPIARPSPFDSYTQANWSQ